MYKYSGAPQDMYTLRRPQCSWYTPKAVEQVRRRLHHRQREQQRSNSEDSRCQANQSPWHNRHDLKLMQRFTQTALEDRKQRKNNVCHQSNPTGPLPVGIGTQKLAVADLWGKPAAHRKTLSCHRPLWLALPPAEWEGQVQHVQNMHPVTLHDDIQNNPTAQITPRPPALS